MGESRSTRCASSHHGAHAFAHSLICSKELEVRKLYPKALCRLQPSSIQAVHVECTKRCVICVISKRCAWYARFVTSCRSIENLNDVNLGVKKSKTSFFKHTRSACGPTKRRAPSSTCLCIRMPYALRGRTRLAMCGRRIENLNDVHALCT